MAVLATSQKPKQKILASVEFKPYFKHDNFVLYNADSIDLLSSLPKTKFSMIDDGEGRVMSRSI